MYIKLHKSMTVSRRNKVHHRAQHGGQIEPVENRMEAMGR